MGDIADMMLDGTLCEGCGVYMDSEGHGVHRRCAGCQEPATTAWAPAAKVNCEVCRKRVKLAGITDHMRVVHGVKPPAKVPADPHAGETEGDYWRDVRPAMAQASQERRANNRDTSAQQLQQAGIRFTTSNGGVHLVVTAGAKTIDFWPGTDLWIVRGDKKKWRGVRNLINHITRSAKP